MGTPVQAGEPEVVALAEIAGRQRADLSPDGIPVSLLQGLADHISCDRIPVTVRKHLETIFMRPGVPSRTAAITRAFPGQVAV